jgi:hypothetical protein
MKKLHAAFEDLFTGGKMVEPATQPQSSPVTVTSFSQPHVLQTRMKEEQLSHGGTVKANLSPVRLDMDHGAVVMYFCPMQNLQVLEVVAEGDGGNIPAEVKLDGLNIPTQYRSGLYDLKNVEVTSNGSIQVRETKDTKWEYIGVGMP